MKGVVSHAIFFLLEVMREIFLSTIIFVHKNCHFCLLDIVFDCSSYSIFYINIVYFVMTSFIIIDTLIMTH
jgi:hypothetical protein